MSAEGITQGIDRDLAEHFQILDTRFLVAIHHGDVDVVKLARQELMNRGLNGEGRWVGFAKPLRYAGVVGSAEIACLGRIGAGGATEIQTLSHAESWRHVLERIRGPRSE
jgi:hypothetical protein